MQLHCPRCGGERPARAIERGWRFCSLRCKEQASAADALSRAKAMDGPPPCVGITARGHRRACAQHLDAARIHLEGLLATVGWDPARGEPYDATFGTPAFFFADLQLITEVATRELTAAAPYLRALELDSAAAAMQAQRSLLEQVRPTLRAGGRVGQPLGEAHAAVCLAISKLRQLQVAPSDLDRERDVLVDAAAARPDDLAARLVLADWLMEHGEAWGQVIAAQCGGGVGATELAALLEDTRWLGPLHDPRIRWRFEGGLPVGLSHSTKYKVDIETLDGHSYELQFGSAGTATGAFWCIESQYPDWRSTGPYRLSPWPALRGECVLPVQISLCERAPGRLAISEPLGGLPTEYWHAEWRGLLRGGCLSLDLDPPRELLLGT